MHCRTVRRTFALSLALSLGLGVTGGCTHALPRNTFTEFLAADWDLDRLDGATSSRAAAQPWDGPSLDGGPERLRQPANRVPQSGTPPVVSVPKPALPAAGASNLKPASLEAARPERSPGTGAALPPG